MNPWAFFPLILSSVGILLTLEVKLCCTSTSINKSILKEQFHYFWNLWINLSNFYQNNAYKPSTEKCNKQKKMFTNKKYMTFYEFYKCQWMQKKFKKYKNKYKHNGGTFIRKLILVLGSWYYHEFFISSNLEIIVGLLISKFVETFIFSWFSTYSGDWRKTLIIHF